ncbi:MULTISPECIES: hypothetical protein [unclassified Moorena]|uniref:hypothetical protein n=1 Tax=unclassified Moorena TaxID=2683338 RepID=UPI0013CCFA32|nr:MULTISPECIES: hypothetical protein [unclassified Moorena]NEP36867.1 hypothetical protein [Moorena sp. SIO3B2]
MGFGRRKGVGSRESGVVRKRAKEFLILLEIKICLCYNLILCIFMVLLLLDAIKDAIAFRNSQFPIPNSRFPIPDSRFPIPDSRFPIP